MRILTVVVFYPMLWLRGLVLVLGHLVSGVAGLAAVVMVLSSVFTRHRFWLPAGLLALSGQSHLDFSLTDRRS